MPSEDRFGRRLKLRDLRILLAVASSGSMGKAAKQLAVSQPVVSKAVAELEHAAGVRLFDRSPQGIEPTMYGRALLKGGVAMFDDLRSTMEELQALADPGAGELRIGCTEPMTAGFVPFVVDRLTRQYPRAVFHVVTADPGTLYKRDLQGRNIDLAVAPTVGLTAESDAHIEVLFNDRHVILASRHSRWARRRKVTLAELMDEPWVLPPPDTPIGAYIAEIFRAAGTKAPSARVVTFSILMHLRLLVTGRFITTLPVSMLHFTKHLPLKMLPVDSPVRDRPVGIVTLKNRMLNPLAQRFIEAAREIAGPLASADSMHRRRR